MGKNDRKQKKNRNGKVCHAGMEFSGRKTSLNLRPNASFLGGGWRWVRVGLFLLKGRKVFLCAVERWFCKNRSALDIGPARLVVTVESLGNVALSGSIRSQWGLLLKASIRQSCLRLRGKS